MLAKESATGVAWRSSGIWKLSSHGFNIVCSREGRTASGCLFRESGRHVHKEIDGFGDRHALWIKKLTWLQVISMARRGVVAAVTMSVLSMRSLLIAPCPRHRAPHHCGDPDPFRTIGQTSADFSNHRVLNVFWKVNKHGAFSIPRKALGLRPNDQSCHHETWLHLDFVDWSNKWSNQDYDDGNICLKERPADSSCGTRKRYISEVMSDHSLSS